MKPLPNRDRNRKITPPNRRQQFCLTCGNGLHRKRSGRLPKFCSPRCRDRAYEGRTFEAHATVRVRNKAIRRNAQKKLANTTPCEGAFADRGSIVCAAGSATLMPALADMVPSYIEAVTIYAHDDRSGRTGALALAERFYSRGNIDVFIEGLP